MTLVEAPVADHRDPEPVGPVEGDVRGRDRAAQQRRVDDVGQQVVLDEELAPAFGLGPALVGERHIDPTGELVGRIPFALAVPHQDQGAVAHGR